MKLRVAPLLAQFKEGLYPALVESLELQQGTFGDYLKWSFSLRSTIAEVTVTGLTSTIFNPKSKFYRWAAAVTGRDFYVNDELDTETLRGAPCRIYVVVKALDGGGSINQVERVLPPDFPRARTMISPLCNGGAVWMHAMDISIGRPISSSALPAASWRAK